MATTKKVKVPSLADYKPRQKPAPTKLDTTKPRRGRPPKKIDPDDWIEGRKSNIRIIFDLPRELRDEFRDYCQERGMTVSGLLRVMIRERIKSKK